MQDGFTLVELIVGLVFAGVLMLISIPPVVRLRNRGQVAAVASELVLAVRRAREEAFTRNTQVDVQLTPDSLWIIAQSGLTSTPVWSTPGPRARGVQLVGPTTVIRVAPSGLPVGVVNGTWRVSRGAVLRRVVISRYGRIRILP